MALTAEEMRELAALLDARPKSEQPKPRKRTAREQEELLHLAFMLDRKLIERGEAPAGYTIAELRRRINLKLERLGCPLIPRCGKKPRLAWVNPEAPINRRAISRARRRQRRWRA